MNYSQFVDFQTRKRARDLERGSKKLERGENEKSKYMLILVII